MNRDRNKNGSKVVFPIRVCMFFIKKGLEEKNIKESLERIDKNIYIAIWTATTLGKKFEF